MWPKGYPNYMCFYKVHYTSAKLVRMGVRDDPSCTRCMRDHGELIHMLWKCPKLHIYWKEVVGIINRVFQIQLVEHSKLCLLGIIDEVTVEETSRLAIARVLFQARKLILRHWKSTDNPTVKEWLTQMGDTIRLEKCIYQHNKIRKNVGIMASSPWFSPCRPDYGPLTYVTWLRQ